MQRSGAFKSDLEVSEGRFLRQKQPLHRLGHRRRLLRLPRRARALPPLRRARLPVVAAHDDRAPPQGPRGRDRDLLRQPLPRRARLGLRGRRLRRRPPRLGLPLARPTAPATRPSRAASACRCCGTARRAGSSTTTRPTSSACSTARGTSGATPRSTSTPSRCAPRSTRSTRGSTTTSTTASTRPGSRARRRPTTRPSTASSPRCHGSRRSSAQRRYLTGDTLTEADWRAWVTLLRFDPVYHTHFRLNGRRVMDHPNLWGFTRELYQLPGHRRDDGDRRDQDALLHDARRAQPQAHHPPRPAGLGPDGAARARLTAAAYSTRVNQVTTIGSSSVRRQPGSPSSSATSSRQHS